MSTPSLQSVLQFQQRLKDAVALCTEHAAGPHDDLYGLEFVVRYYLGGASFNAHALKLENYEALTGAIETACKNASPRCASADFVPMRCVEIIGAALVEMKGGGDD